MHACVKMSRVQYILNVTVPFGRVGFLALGTFMVQKEPCCIGIYISLGVLRLTLPLRMLCAHCLGRGLCHFAGFTTAGLFYALCGKMQRGWFTKVVKCNRIWLDAAKDI